MVFIHLEENCDYNQFTISDIYPEHKTLPHWDNDDLSQARGYANSKDCVLILGKNSDDYVNGEVIFNSYLFDIYYDNYNIESTFKNNYSVYDNLMSFPSKKIYIGEIFGTDQFYIETKTSNISVKVFSEEKDIEKRQHFTIILTDEKENLL
jgi:hypothetical protein